ncbi:MAG: NTP transferase domain-containing protein, partial [Anaeroplasmataceae bacterium]|nr:NTP transferase domain-containing protein [Anaeroplasmataceae bacterium]
MTRNEFDILHYIYKNGKKSYRDISKATEVSIGTVSKVMKQLLEKQYIFNDEITSLGMQTLEAYRVHNAIILAAGPSSRFVPLSLEQPKGLFKVRGEILIERQIQQLQDAGIENIYLVLGYKKEAFFYLKDKYNVHFIINTEYNKKNNIESLYIAKDKLGSSYICSSDDYFTINPFQKYEYQTFYASIYTPQKTKEMYVDVNTKDEIIVMAKGRPSGNILLGHSYWNEKFSKAFTSLMEKYHDTGEYDGAFWEKLVADHLSILPKMEIKRYPEDTIFEFDFVEELRAFDNKYVNHTESKIMANICLALKCNEADIFNFKPVYEGLTNTSFIFTVKNIQYVYRQPGEGTGAVINRKHEKIALEVAKENQFDPTFLYMDENEGWKISYYIPSFREPDYANPEDSKIVIQTLQRLHKIQVKEIDWTFEPVAEALKLETALKEKTTIAMSDFDELKERILKLYEKTKGDGIEKCFCHGDTYKHNWMITPTSTLLIDWEYAGLGDPGIDVGYYIVDAMYSFEEADQFIRAYCKDTYSDALRFHYLAYTAIIAYYWFVWALYRESFGAIIGESLYNWYTMAKTYSLYLEKEYAIQSKLLNRYEFEVLKYIAENSNVPYDSRSISNSLLFSWDKVKGILAEGLEKGILKNNSSTLSITEKGKALLEPYQVERAVIMAAGFGSRMVPITLERPKPLVKVNGIRIIDTLLDALISKGIKEIYIVTGYKKEMFGELLEKYPFLQLIENDDYNITNNISSIMKALPHIDNCYICEADFLVSNPNIISKYHYCSNYLGAYVRETDDWCFRSENQYAVDYKKENTNCYQAFGISYWNAEDSKKLRSYLPQIYKTKKGKQEFWESCIFNYYKNDFKVEINICS